MQALPLTGEFATFRSGGFVFALNVVSILKVVPCYGYSILPEAPATILGLTVYGGVIVPILDSAALFRSGTPAAPKLESRFLVVKPNDRILILSAEEVLGVRTIASGSYATSELVGAGMARLQGVGHRDEDLIYIFDPEKLLLPDEACAVDKAMQAHAAMQEPVP